MIQIKNLEKAYDNFQKHLVLQGLSLSVDDGEFLGIMGASGSGKSTFLRIVGGLETYSAGEVSVFDQDLRVMKESERELYRKNVVSFVFQDYNLLSGLTVKENIILPYTMMEMDENKIEQEYSAIAKQLGINKFENRFSDEVSGGEQQRAAIARAVIKKSKLLLADEPTGSLDARTGRKVLELFGKINADYHVTVIMVTHDVLCASFCSRVAFLRDGKFVKAIKKIGSQENFYRNIQEEMGKIDEIF
jgi:ABC-type lipoprotein export system ATPase subunit